MYTSFTAKGLWVLIAFMSPIDTPARSRAMRAAGTGAAGMKYFWARE